MALLVLIVVGVVVAQTWVDWRDSNKGWVVPDWAKGMALGGIVGVLLAAAASFASVWLRDPAAQWTGGAGSRTFWLELGFLLSVMGIIVFAARRKRLRLIFLVACVLAVITWFGMSL